MKRATHSYKFSMNYFSFSYSLKLVGFQILYGYAELLHFFMYISIPPSRTCREHSEQHTHTHGRS
jgi:hypothetical protein